MKHLNKLAMVVLLAVMSTACSKVSSGYVGVKVNLLGGDKGVDTEELGVGRYYIGVNEELYLFPTYKQNVKWQEEGKKGAFNFQSREGMVGSIDIGMSYKLDAARISEIFQTYRKGIDEITELYVRNKVRDSLNLIASGYSMEELYGKKKPEFINAVSKAVSDSLAVEGIIVEDLYAIGAVDLPTTMVRALNAKIEATQKAQQRENEVQQAMAEAEISRQEAQGVADAQLIKAKAEAEAINVKGRALRDNPAILELNAVEKWDGKLPVYAEPSAVPFLNLK